ncbi:MAG: Gfo/Idh/MocA family oxidoreductase, partial [Minisyncoccia bacterium]
MSDLHKKIDKLIEDGQVAVIGAGYWGKNLVRVFHELGALKIVCDLSEKNLSDRKKDHPNLDTTNDFSKILADKDIQAVVIATPAVTHYDICKKSILAGKDVFVEKPLALKVEEAEELVQIAKENSRILMVGHLLLYHPAVIKLKELIDRGELGDIRYIYSNRLNFGKLRKEENVLWSFAPHDISVIIDILGSPKKVTSIGKAYLQKDIPDTTMSVLEFEGEKAAHIFVSWLNPFKEQKLSVIGSK